MLSISQSFSKSSPAVATEYGYSTCSTWDIRLRQAVGSAEFDTLMACIGMLELRKLLVADCSTDT